MWKRTCQRAATLQRLWRHWSGPRGAFLAFADGRLRQGRPTWLGTRRGQETLVRVQGAPHPFHARLGGSDLSVICDMFVRGEYDSAVAKVAERPRLIVDLGSNIGASVRLFASRWPDADILAVEPESANFRLLRANVQCVDRPERIRAVQACIAASRGVVRLKTDGEPWAFQMDRTSDSPTTGSSFVEVPAIPLHDLLDEHALNGPIDLLKCDVEGAEREIFDACAPWIQRVRVLAVELHDPYTFDQFVAAVEAGGGRFNHQIVRREPGITVLVSTRA